MLRAVVCCDSVLLCVRRFLKICYDDNIKVEYLGGFRYTVKDMRIDFIGQSRKSLVGERSDIFVTDLTDKEIERYRVSILSRSQFKKGKDIRSTKDLMEFIKSK